MRDPRLGAFGGAGLALFLLLKVSAVMAISPSAPAWGIWPGSAPFALLLAPALARWLILLAAGQPMARPGGLGAEFSLGVTRRVYLWAAILPLGLLVVGSPRALLAAGLAHLVALAIFALARARLGGLTGDVLGLVIELGELAVLVTFAVR
jgi:adenosylcobinamide-GDP ribazoletransferase